MPEGYANFSLSLLVIEDDDVDLEKNLRLLSKTLLNLKIATAATATQARTLVTTQIFDCVLLDYHLKDALGSELIQALQYHKSTPTPILMISGNSDERVIADVMRDGIFDYLPKRDLSTNELRKALLASQIWAETEKQASEARQRLNQLAEGLPQLIWTCLPDGRCDFLNRRWCEYTGIDQKAQLNFGWLEQVHLEDREQLKKSWMHATATGTEMFMIFRIRRHDGVFRWFDTRAIPQRNDQGDIVRWLGSNTDITDIELTRQALLHSERLFHAAFDYAPLGMIMIDMNEKIVQVNPALCQLLNYQTEAIASLNKPLPPQLVELIHPEELLNTRFHLNKLLVEKIVFTQFESRLLTEDSNSIPVILSLSLINNNDTEACYLIQVYDLSERKRYESQLIQLAHYDSLTGLGNRAKLHNEIDFLIQKSHRNSAPFGVLFCDIDHFKNINDSHGHEAGDHLLKVIARRLQKTLRHEDSICRLGGDEFVILLQDVTRFEAVVKVAEKVIERVKKPIRISNEKIQIGMSLGIALYPTDGDDSKTLLRNADSALYDAKAKGRGCYQLYRKELTEYVNSRLQLDTDLRRAISQQEFELFYQPIIDLKTQEVVMIEALLRWQHPTKGILLPDEFIPYAQDSGLIIPLGEWVINHACAQAAQLNATGLHLPVSINLSARQFTRHNLWPTIQAALTKTQLPASDLIVEITEQVFLENTEDNLKQIQELKDNGVKIALDDIGAGYSSLNYIVRFAPHYLKIDNSFISQINEDKDRNEMIRAIIGLGNILPIEIIGEGIETTEQVNYLALHGCDLGQGRLFTRPLNANELLTYLNRDQSLPKAIA
jgi:diguanylate cyclase (GGDEF)-like protein/PAS domain S-box-containing protein